MNDTLKVKVVMLESEEPSRLGMNTSGKIAYFDFKDEKLLEISSQHPHYRNQHLYLVSTNPIEIGACCIDKETLSAIVRASDKTINFLTKTALKIEATTDGSLIYGSRCSNCKVYLCDECEAKQKNSPKRIPKCFIQEWIDDYNKHKLIKDILIHVDYEEIPCPDHIQGCEVLHTKQFIKTQNANDIIWDLIDNVVDTSGWDRWTVNDEQLENTISIHLWLKNQGYKLIKV